MGNFDREFKARQKWIENYFQYGSVSIAARKCGIPRSTLYRWIKRFEEIGEEALKGKSKRPKRLAQQKIRERDEKKVLSLREKYKWGPQRLAVYFLREEKRNISSMARFFIYDFGKKTQKFQSSARRSCIGLF